MEPLNPALTFRVLRWSRLGINLPATCWCYPPHSCCCCFFGAILYQLHRPRDAGISLTTAAPSRVPFPLILRRLLLLLAALITLGLFAATSSLFFPSRSHSLAFGGRQKKRSTVPNNKRAPNNVKSEIRNN